MLENFIKVRTLNKSLKDKICDLLGENEWLEEAVEKYKILLKEKKWKDSRAFHWTRQHKEKSDDAKF